MNNFILAILDGVIQGITEFLPVSSSGHLVLIHSISELSVSNEILFDVILHLATILAVIWFFWNDIINIALSWLKSFKGQKNEQSRLAWMIIISTVPAVFAGLLFGDWFESLRDPLVVVVMLVVVGILFIIAEKTGKKNLDIESIGPGKSLYIGVAQALALIPGTSRSGITIIAGLFVGIRREAAIKFSFLMSIPVILGANVKKISDSSLIGLSQTELSIYLVAFLAAFITAIFTIKYFLRYARNHTLIPFAIYRFILALLVFVFLV